MNTRVRSFENPVTGEHVTMLATTEETEGTLVKTRTTLPSGAIGVALHYHLSYTETFTVVEGRLDMCIGGKKQYRRVESGETVHVPLRVPHRFRNSSDQPVTYLVEIRPACHFEQALRAFFGLTQEGKVNRAGRPTNIWQLALLFEISDSFFPGLPLGVQKRLFGSLARIARWRGYDSEFSRYTRQENYS